MRLDPLWSYVENDCYEAYCLADVMYLSPNAEEEDLHSVIKAH
ncbi:hypothetical protein P4534_03240 [Peribacillus butanolivorans]|nr:hypothetical protein [Peribacillus butanolivorans]